MLNWKKAFIVKLRSLLDGVVDEDNITFREAEQIATFPSVTYFIVDDIAALESGPDAIRAQVDIWAKFDVDAETIRELLRAGLHNKPFTVIGADHQFLMEIDRRDMPFEMNEEVVHKVLEYRSYFWREG